MRHKLIVAAAFVLILLVMLRVLGLTVPDNLRAFNHSNFDWLGLAAAIIALVCLESSERLKKVARAIPPVAISVVDRLLAGGRKPMTNFGGRYSFDVRLAARLRDGAPCTVLLIGIDRFKRINSEYGSAFGDELLQRVGDRLRGVMSDPNGVAYQFSDEFAILAADATTEDETASLALQVLRAFDAAFTLNGKSITLSVSIGIAEAPARSCDTVALMRAATRALDAAKLAGRGVWRVYDASMQDIEGALRIALPAAIAERQILPYYQPIVDLSSGRVTGMEVLARWHHPTRGVLPPTTFITLAEEEGRLSDITRSLLRQVAIDARQWPDHLSFAFNIAPNQLRDVLLYAAAAPDAHSCGLSPQRIQIELTETALIKDLDATCEVVRMLRGRGVRVVLGDFGAGQGNFHHLSGIPFDGLKIGREFVVDMLTQQRAAFCVNCMASVGEHLGIDITAEGVSTTEILAKVDALGCRFVQGSLFSMPVPETGVQAVLNRLGSASRIGQRSHSAACSVGAPAIAGNCAA